MAETHVYFDGLCQPVNPGGIACYAFLVKSDNRTIYNERGLAAEPFSKEATNNVAEYTALVKALEWLVANGFESGPVRVMGDSKLVISQIRGEFKIKNKALIPLFQKAALLKNRFADIAFQWIPREENKEADKLSEKAYNKALLDDPRLMDRIRK
jgi:ribonuclease HI